MRRSRAASGARGVATARADRAGDVPGGAGAGPVDLVEMRVTGMAAEPLCGLPVVTLADEAGRTCVSLDVGMLEAPAIASELAGVALERPATHDLLKAIVEGCGARVDAVELRDVRAGVVLATIVLRVVGGAPVEVDARPSDALALALRTRATVRVARKVIEWSRRRESRRRRDTALLRGDEPPGGELDLETAALSALTSAFILESLPDEEFGKWKM